MAEGSPWACRQLGATSWRRGGSAYLLSVAQGGIEVVARRSRRVGTSRFGTSVLNAVPPRRGVARRHAAPARRGVPASIFTASPTQLLVVSMTQSFGAARSRGHRLAARLFSRAQNRWSSRSRVASVPLARRGFGARGINSSSFHCGAAVHEARDWGEQRAKTLVLGIFPILV
jgi:hypothetical protein